MNGTIWALKGVVRIIFYIPIYYFYYDENRNDYLFHEIQNILSN
jgi:hypothetical protein